jgi:threonine aldolase
MPGVEIDPATVETNILVFAVPDAPAFCEALEEAGVMMIPLDARRVRAVTHLDVVDDGIDQALQAAERALRAPDSAPAA